MTPGFSLRRDFQTAAGTSTPGSRSTLSRRRHHAQRSNEEATAPQRQREITMNSFISSMQLGFNESFSTITVFQLSVSPLRCRLPLRQPVEYEGGPLRQYRHAKAIQAAGMDRNGTDHRTQRGAHF